MKKLFIGGLVAAELAMVVTALPSRFEPGALIAPPTVDAKWARAMARKADHEALQDQRRSGHRRAIDACLGPDRESFSPTRYETKLKACEAQLAQAAAAVQPEPAPSFEYPKPSQAPPPAPAPIDPVPAEPPSEPAL